MKCPYECHKIIIIKNTIVYSGELRTKGNKIQKLIYNLWKTLKQFTFLIVPYLELASLDIKALGCCPDTLLAKKSLPEFYNLRLRHCSYHSSETFKTIKLFPRNPRQTNTKLWRIEGETVGKFQWFIIKLMGKGFDWQYPQKVRNARESKCHCVLSNKRVKVVIS